MAQSYQPAIKLEKLSFGTRDADSGPPIPIPTAEATFGVTTTGADPFKLVLTFDVGESGEAGVLARARLELHLFTQALAASAPKSTA